MNGQPRFTILGKLFSVVLVLGLIGLGVYMIRSRSAAGPSESPAAEKSGGGTAEVTEVKVEVPNPMGGDNGSGGDEIYVP